MNKTFTQHVVVPRHALRSESKVAEKHHKKLITNLIYGSAFCIKIFLFGILAQALILQTSFAQTANQNVLVKGVVYDDIDGQTIPGITIMDNSKKVLGVTNEKGAYSVSVPKGASISFSMIGYTTITRVISDTQNNLVIRMKENTSQLNEVVVTTALGIKRQQKSLGFATTTIDSTQLTNAVANNWTDALSGKVAGLNLVRSNGGPAGSTKIILRGENNLTGDNEALIVLDGVVISNSGGRRSANASDAVYGTGSDNMPADYGSTINDINPEDIESVTVLKGPGAAALYGQRGANGAVIITTKSGSSKRTKNSVNIKFTSNGSFEEVNRWPDLQYEYGQGLDGAAYYSYGASADGASTSGTSSAYGPRFDGQSFFQYDGTRQGVGLTRTPWVPFKNQIRDFFDTGYNITNSLSLDGKIGKTNGRISITNQDNTWIVPKSGMERTSVSLSTTTKATEDLTFTTKLTYNNRFSDNLPGNGYGNQSIMYWFIFWQPNADLNAIKNYWVNGQENRAIKYPYSSFPENPYAIVNEFINRTNRDNYTGNIAATYNFSKKLSLRVSASLDLTKEKRAQERPYDAGTRLPQGSYRTQDLLTYEASGDFLLRYNTTVGRDLKLTASVGGQQLRNKYTKRDLRADGLRIPNIYRLDNNLYPLISIPDTALYRFNSLLAIANLEYKDYLFLELSIRKDYNSALATPTRTDNVGFSYPAASLAFSASDYWKLPKAISSAKLRFSASQVGSGGTTPYRTAYNYQLAANGIYPDSALTNPGLLPNVNLKPLKTTTFEFGAEMSMLKGRLGFDVAYYLGHTNNQILTRIVDRSSGFNSAIVNAGQINNSGVEVAINGTPISAKKKGGFNWNSNITFATNKNKIISLPDSSIIIGTGPIAGGQIVAKVGGSMGDLYGRGYVRSPDGQVVYDATTGFAKITDDVIYLGNTTAKYKFGFQNTFSLGNVSLGLLFDAQLGGVAHSLLNYKMVEQGKLQVTVPGRYNGIVGNGVIRNADGSYRKNDVITFDIDEYYRSHMGADNAEGSTFKTDFIKWREATLNWKITNRWIKNTGLSSVTIGVYGRNLFIWSPWPMFDPEFGTLNGSDISKGFEIGQLPSTRTFGFNLSIGI
ncbi:SusC/RagA family TonB-linked outer membrane protein [Pedobacter frigiditerrae]|uniref:SusC/RagA family TonB-linked outer membrane protein n=1 Tax=Pedobacter frigiditerrae TaxID=2530452 RepID=UPI00292D80B5|nr:SusC/RagA family TonB-linked outer membrane protein [Pedobacter frigiditerrae]